MQKIALFGGSPLSPSTRFRLEQYLPYWEAQGYKAYLFHSFSPPSSLNSTSRPSQLFFNIQRYTTYILNIFRHLSQIGYIEKDNTTSLIHGFMTPFLSDCILENLLRKRTHRMVVDFDDAIFTTNIRTQEKLTKILKLCDAAVVGNKYLADFASQYQENIYIVPTPIETDYFIPTQKTDENSSQITIGWMGGWVNVKHLEGLITVFQTIKKEVPSVKIVVVTNLSALPSSLSQVAELRQWSLSQELFDLQSFDIGLMPLEDNSFTKGKCSFKLLQYMAVGIPVVASPVGMNQQVVRDNGFLCDSENEWIEALLLLCKNRDLRLSMGKRSREIAESDYSTKVIFPKLLAAVVGEVTKQNES